MRLQILQDGPWKIVSPVEGDGDEAMTCALVEELEHLKATYEGSVLGIYQLWMRIDHIGPRRLGNELYRCVDEKNGIYEFRKGDLRVFSFTLAGAICVCANVGIKHGRKVDMTDVRAALKIQSMVSGASLEGALEFVKVKTDGKIEILSYEQLLKTRR